MSRSSFIHRRGYLATGTLLATDSFNRDMFTLGAISVSDTFNRANSTNNLGATDGSGSADPKTWVQQTGTFFGINTNQAYISATGVARATVDPAIAGVSVSSTIAVNANLGEGILFRFASATQYWSVNTSAGSWRLTQFNSSGNILATGPSLLTGDVLRAACNGNTIVPYVNGIPFAVVSDTFNNTATKHGINIGSGASTGVRHDNFSVYPTSAYLGFGATDGSGYSDPLTWTFPYSEVWGLGNNTAVKVTAGTSGLTLDFAVVDLRTPNMDIRVDTTRRSVASGCGLVFRYVDKDNHWRLVNGNTGNTQLIKRVAGTPTTVNTTAGGADGDTLRAVALGTAIAVYRNGSLLATTTSSDMATATKAGLVDQSGTPGTTRGNQWDNFFAYAS